MGGVRLDEISKLKEFESSLTIGICTDDFLFIHDAAAELSERGIGSALISPGERYEGRLDVLIMDPKAEIPHFKERAPKIIGRTDSCSRDIDRAVATAMEIEDPELLLIGIDPGKRPGIAFIADGHLVKAIRSYTGQDLKEMIATALSAYRPERALLRIGDGDPERRDIIIGELLDLSIAIEIVDERRTSTSIRFRDESAAIKIARSSGDPR